MSSQAGYMPKPVSARNRPTRQAAAQHRYADMKVEDNVYAYEEQTYTNGAPQQPAARVDLNKMKANTLRKYAKAYDLPGVHSQSSKEELTSAVSRHWSSVSINEDVVLQSLVRMRGRY